MPCIQCSVRRRGLGKVDGKVKGGWKGGEMGKEAAGGKGAGSGMQNWEGGAGRQELGCRRWGAGAGMQELGYRSRYAGPGCGTGMWCWDVVPGSGTGMWYRAAGPGCRAGLWHRAALRAPRSRRQCRARPREGAGPAHPAQGQPRPEGSRRFGARTASCRHCRVLKAYRGSYGAMTAPCRLGGISQGAGTSSQTRTPLAAAVRFAHSPAPTREMPNANSMFYSTKKSGAVT